MSKPVIGTIYTVRQILDLELTDSPCLLIPTPEQFGFGGWSAVQDPDMGWQAALDVIGDVLFEYNSTTEEMIPVFYFADDALELKCFDISLDLLPYGEGACWVLPKGDTRKQEYHWVEPGVSIASEYDVTKPAPEWMVRAYNAINQV